MHLWCSHYSINRFSHDVAYMYYTCIRYNTGILFKELEAKQFWKRKPSFKFAFLNARSVTDSNSSSQT